jgi:oxalate---CoA ligase
VVTRHAGHTVSEAPEAGLLDRADALQQGPKGWSNSQSLLQLITERAAALDDNTFVEDARSGRRISYRDLLEVVRLWGHGLGATQVEPGQVVAVVITDPIEFTLAYLALMANRRWVAPIDPAAPSAVVGAACSRLQPRLVISDGRVGGGDDGARWVAPVTVTTARVPAAAGYRSAPPWLSPASGGAILSSSGSSGRQKLIPLHEHQLLHGARAVARHHRLAPGDVGFNALPLFHVNAEVVGLLSTLYAGARLVLDDRFHRTGFWDLMDRRAVTWINAVPPIVDRLSSLRPGEGVPPRIRFIRSASSPLPVATRRRFEWATGLPVLETYGMTEAAGQITAMPLVGPDKPGSVGLPVDIDVRIVPTEPTGQPAVGLVQIRGASVATHPQPEEPAEPGAGVEIAQPLDEVVTETASDHGGGWLDTGDLGYQDDDGYLYLVGRADDVINRGGEKVYPPEIEEVLAAEPCVKEVVVVGVDHPALGQEPWAYLTLHGITDRTGVWQAVAVGDRLRRRLGDTLAPRKWPAALCVVDRLPTTATGKVLRRSIRSGGVETIATVFTR